MNPDVKKFVIKYKIPIGIGIIGIMLFGIWLYDKTQYERIRVIPDTLAMDYTPESFTVKFTAESGRSCDRTQALEVLKKTEGLELAMEISGYNKWKYIGNEPCGGAPQYTYARVNMRGMLQNEGDLKRMTIIMGGKKNVFLLFHKDGKLLVNSVTERNIHLVASKRIEQGEDTE